MEETRLRLCHVLILHYSTKCPCFKAQQSCTSKCRCKRCKNPHGQRPDVDKLHGVQKRKRDRHDSQVHLLRGKKTAKFIDEISEEMTTGSMSDFEYLLVQSYTTHILKRKTGLMLTALIYTL